MASILKMCYGCKQKFRKSELIDYAAPMTVTMHSYCPKCLVEKQQREAFSDKVCSIFGIKSPGPIIWTERKRLIKKYGYTDETIIDCLDYLYKVKKVRKLAESLYLVTPSSVNEMLKYKHSLEVENIQLAHAIADTEIREQIVSVKENIDNKDEELNPDDWLSID